MISLLRAGAKRLESEIPLKLVTLFGSWAKGRATASSDIDLLVVHKGAGGGDPYRTISRALGLRGVELHIFTEEEFEAFTRQSPRTRKEWVDEAIVIYAESGAPT